MGFDSDLHHRKTIRLQGYDYSQAGAYFITVCAHQRQQLFGEIVNGEMSLNRAGEVVAKVWHELPQHYANIELGEYVVMPNHFHGIVYIVGMVGAIPVRAIHESPQQSPQPDKNQRRKMLLPKLIGRFKMVSAKQINQFNNTSGHPVWQRNYYEHIIRNEKAYLRIAEYIQTNPLKWQDDVYHV